MSDAVPAPRATEIAVGFTPTDALLALMILIWGLNYILLKAILVHVEPVALNAARFSITAVAFAIIILTLDVKRPSRQDLPRFLALGVLGNTIYQFTFIIGVAMTEASNAALIMAAVPVQTAVLSHLKGIDRLRGRDAAGFVLSTLGIVTIIAGSAAGVRLGAHSAVWGDLLIFSGTLCWSAYVIGGKPLTDRYGATSVTAWTMLFGAVPLVLVSLPRAFAQPWRATPSSAIWGLVVSALGALVFAYLIYFRGVKRLGPSRTAMYSNFTPVVAALGAWAILGERPTTWQGAGAIGIFTGLWLTRT